MLLFSTCYQLCYLCLSPSVEEQLIRIPLLAYPIDLSVKILLLSRSIHDKPDQAFEFYFTFSSLVIFMDSLAN